MEKKNKITEKPCTWCVTYTTAVAKANGHTHCKFFVPKFNADEHYLI